MKPYLLYLFLLLSAYTFAQKAKTKTAEKPASENSILAKVEGLKKFPGFIDFYYDEKQDKVFLEIRSFNEEMLYVNSLPAGIGSNDIGLDRGQLGGERIVKFDRRGPKVLLIEPNYKYRAITSNWDERNAVQEAFAQSVIYGFKIEAEDNNAVLVDATDFLLQDAHQVIETLKSTQQGSYSLDKSRSALYSERIKNFPDNSEFESLLTFTGTPAGNFIRSVAPTPSIVTVRQHHSFVRLPDDQYEPRLYDPRAGFFAMSYFDYATPINQSIDKKFIARHRLKKKDPSASFSEPVEPVIYYLDRGTPEPIRSALLDGARWWNQAFEAAGFKDAFRVEMMPEDADPMDVRYNVIQWVHRSTRGWSYGASVMDPRTGEIIKGHVSLGSLRVRQDFLIAEGLLAPYKDGQPVSKKMEEMALARLRQLSAHEVGHTLGLAHSYASSTEDLASVMDYPHPVVRMQDGIISLENAYDDKIGAWDKIAIAYGYQEFPKETDEKIALDKIIQNGLAQGLTFLSDQDARPNGSAHPFAHLWDNGKDAADELAHVMRVRAQVLKNFGADNIRPGAPMSTIEEVLVPMYFFHRYQVEASVKLVGGLNYRYALRGDGQLATEWVPAAQQLKALDQLLKTISTEALVLPESLLRNIPPRPLGYPRTRELIKGRTDLTFDPLTAAESAADLTLSLLFQVARANRIVEHNSRNPTLPSLNQVMSRAIDFTFKAPEHKDYAGVVQMLVANVALNNMFKLAAHKDASAIVKAITESKLQEIKVLASSKASVPQPEIWKSHYQYIVKEINRFMDDPDEFKTAPVLTPPPGQPIGQRMQQYCSDPE